MSARRVTCPQCDEDLILDAEMASKPRVRCPDCQTVFSTSRKRKSQTAEPMRRRARRRQSSRGNGMLVAVITVCSAVLLALVVGGLFAIGVFRDKDGSDPLGGDLSSPNRLGNKHPITKGDLQRIQAGMTLEAVQVILGSGKPADQEDIKRAFGNNSGDHKGPPEEQWMENGRQAGVTNWYQWRADDSSLFVGFAKGKRSGKLKALLIFWVERFPTGMGMYGFRSEPGFMVMGDPDDLTDARDADDRILNDPKWKKGNARQLLPGLWKNSFQFSYDFREDGTVKVVGFEPFTSTYRFVDDDHIEIQVPAAQFQPARLEKLRVLVTKDELLLVRQDGQRRVLLDYKRVR